MAIPFQSGQRNSNVSDTPPEAFTATAPGPMSTRKNVPSASAADLRSTAAVLDGAGMSGVLDRDGLQLIRYIFAGIQGFFELVVEGLPA
jgi:hypothetical protein